MAWKNTFLVINSDFRRHHMNKKKKSFITIATEFIALNLVALLFLLGLVSIDIGSFLRFGIEIGLMVTGVSVICIALIMQHEKTLKK